MKLAFLVFHTHINLQIKINVLKDLPCDDTLNLCNIEHVQLITVFFDPK